MSDQSDTKTELTFLEDLKRFQPSPAVMVAWAVLALLLLVIYYQGIWIFLKAWYKEPEYGHCFFVPAFVVFLLWYRREMALPLPDKGSLWGLAFFGMMLVMKIVAFFFRLPIMDAASLIPCIAGIVLLAGGWKAMRWSWQSIVFMVFAVPLPAAITGLLAGPLQKVGAIVATYAIQTLGIPAVRTGNVINLPSAPLEVAGACSGLRMLMLFFAICVGAAFVLRDRPLWERLLIVASAPPIAVMSNIIRIIVTGLLYESTRWWPNTFDIEAIKHAMHDWAGLAMMPLGILLLLAEMLLLSKLLVEPDKESLAPLAGPMQMGGVPGGGIPGGTIQPNQGDGIQD